MYGFRSGNLGVVKELMLGVLGLGLWALGLFEGCFFLGLFVLRYRICWYVGLGFRDEGLGIDRTEH